MDLLFDHPKIFKLFNKLEHGQNHVKFLHSLFITSSKNNSILSSTLNSVCDRMVCATNWLI